MKLSVELHAQLKQPEKEKKKDQAPITK